MRLLPTNILLHFNHIQDIPNSLYQKILRTNFQGSGYMQQLYKELYKHRKYPHTNPITKNHHIVVYIDKEKDKIMSHGLLILNNKGKGEMHVYTSKNYRGSGFGKIIGMEMIKHAYVKQFKKVTCYRTAYGSILWNAIRRQLKRDNKKHLADLIHITKVIF